MRDGYEGTGRIPRRGLKWVRLFQLVFSGVLLSTAAVGPVVGQAIKLQQLWATKGTIDVGEFASITGMIEAAPGVVWVSDARTSRVIALGDNGQGTWVIAREGEGPGEVGAPSYMAHMPNGDIAIYDRESIDLFSSNGEFIRRVAMPLPIVNIKGFTVLPSGEFVISGGVLGNGSSIHKISSDGQLLASWDPIPETKNPRAGVMVAGGPVHALDSGIILFSRAAPHELLRYTSNGRIAAIIARDSDLLAPIGDEFIIERGEGEQFTRSFRWFFPQSRAIIALEDDAILNVVVFREQGRSLWELFTPGRPVVRTYVHEVIRPWGRTSTGGILISSIDPTTGEPIAALIRMIIDEAS